MLRGNSLLRVMKVRHFLLWFMLFTNFGVYSQKTFGTDFWMAFIQNADADIEYEHYLRLSLSAQEATEVIIENTKIGYKEVISLDDNSVKKLIVPFQDFNIPVYGEIVNKSLHIISKKNISVYAENYQIASCDATLLLPTEACGSYYIIQNNVSRTETVTYPFRPSVFNVIAFEDDTEVEITPTLTTTDGKPANEPFKVILNKGDVYQVANRMEDMGKGLSGSQVYVLNGKKVAVYSGNKCSNVPDECKTGDSDILYDVSYPVSSWGKNFIIRPFKSGNNDMIKCTACKDGTKIYKDGILLATINALESYEFFVAEEKGAFKLETSEPVATYQYMTSNSYIKKRSYGGPSYQYVAPIEQAIEEITFNTMSNGLIPAHYLNVIIKTEDVEEVSINGKTNFATFTPIDEIYSTASAPLEDGVYTLKAKNGFVANVYGAGEAVSYSYSVGSKMEAINRLPWDPSVAYDTVCVENVVVENDTIEEMVDIKGKPKEVTIYRHYRQSYSTDISEIICEGENYVVGSESFHSAGEYLIPLTAINGCDSIVHLQLKVAPKESVIFEETAICDTHYEGHGFSIDVKNDGFNTFTQNYINRLGCDSIVTLKLEVVKPVDNTVIPTMFTPHTREGKNDIFMEGYEVYIYDRYGNLVCHSTNGWDGYYRGEVADPGIYIYTLYMKDDKKKKGSIEVFK